MLFAPFKTQRGKRFAPRLVTAMRDSVTGEIRKLPPVELPSVKVSRPEHWDTIVGGMIGVTHDPAGTSIGRVRAAPPIASNPTSFGLLRRAAPK